MSPTRPNNVTSAQWSAGEGLGSPDLTVPGNQLFGANVFSIEVQRQRLSKPAFKKLQAVLTKGTPLDAALADEVAQGMKEWALENGASHYTHWFQPLTGITAEKHDSFYNPAGNGTAIAEFSGNELIRQEPDASSFPSGGLRSTFEARGYSAWDPSSPAFILENPNGALLCIPGAFVSFTGEALDHKTPLLRSMDAVSDASVKALALLGHPEVNHVFSSVGPEQEYFLIDEHYFYSRPDLVLTGRTLFGANPPKGQELDEHYFGSIPERVLAFMMDSEDYLKKLGVPIKTRHNEVAPSQYELAPLYEGTNVGSDHQQLTMQMMQNIARRYGLVCLLHEKPFAGVNGSGKHNNWSIGTNTGVNLMDPGDTPHENLNFLFFCSAAVAAVNKHQALLRATAANVGQEHRLGANEAPPAIISIFLGTDLEAVFDAIADGATLASAESAFLSLGTPILPTLPLHGGDRNRTSPFAFTGNKFEFRMLGSSQSIGLTNTVINTMVAESIDALAAELEAKLADGLELDKAVLAVVKESYTANRNIVFGGDNYSPEWHAEAEKRGLANLPSTPEALPAFIAEDTVAMFEHYGVLSERELHSRYEVFVEQYNKKLNIEAETAASIARSMILPAAVRHLTEISAIELPALIEEVKPLVEELHWAILELEKANLGPDEELSEPDLAIYMRDTVIPAMTDVRGVADRLEKIVADDLWPLPKYQEILFIK
jgi:glutamine synthetase